MTELSIVLWFDLTKYKILKNTLSTLACFHLFCSCVYIPFNDMLCLLVPYMPPSDRGDLGHWSLALARTCSNITARSNMISIIIQQNNTRNEQILVINTIVGKK